MALVGGPLLLIGLLAWPMLFTNAGFSGDWTNHLWFSWSEGLAIRETHHPSFFLNYSHSVFYPQFAFYGSTLYAIVGTLSLLLGEAPIEAYVGAYLLGFAASYGGWYWMARMAGLGRWSANAPGVVFITSAYYVTLIYARGDLPEFSAVSVIPLMLAAALSILRAEHLRLGPAIALSVSAIVFVGSHPLTLVWGSSVIGLVCLSVAAWIPEARRLVSARGALRVAVLFVPAGLVSAWFLLPAIAYQGNTRISLLYPTWRIVLPEVEYMVSANRLFTLSRALVTTPEVHFALALPILAMAWSFVSLVVFPRGLRQPWGRLLVICAAVTTLMTVVMTHGGIILALPRPYAMLVFPYRLESYIVLATSGAVLAGLVLAQRASSRARHWAWAMVPVLGVAIVGAAQQTAAYPRNGGSREHAIESHTTPGPRETGLTDYIDGKLTLLEENQQKAPEIYFPAASVRADHASKVVHLRPGEMVYSNIGAGPELVHVTGATIVGSSALGDDVLRIAPAAAGSKRAPGASHATRWTEVISVSTANGLPIVLGRILSLGALAFLACGLLFLVARRARARARRTSSRGTPRSPRTHPRVRTRRP